MLTHDLVRAIVVAWKSLSSYPPEHPSVVSAMNAAARQLQGHLLGAHSISWGAARDGLIHGEEKLDSPLARVLAESLWARDVAILTFEEGLETKELSAFLRALTLDPLASEVRALGEELAAAGIRHIKVAAVDFSGIRATEDLLEPGARQVSLWEEILRSVLAGKPLSEEGLHLLELGEPASAPLVAGLLRDCLGQLGEGTGALGIGGRQLGSELANAIGMHLGRTQGAALRREVAQQIADLARTLPAALQDMLLDAALRVLACDEESPLPLQPLLKAFEPDTLLRAFQRLGLSGVSLSRHGLQMLQALSRSSRSEVRPGSADLELVRELSTLFRDDDIDRHSPVDHQALFKAAAAVEVPVLSWELLAKEDMGDRLASISDTAVSGALAQSLVETLARQGSREGFEGVLRKVEALYRSLLRAGEVSQPVAIAESLRELRARASSELEARVAETMARLASGDSVPLLVDALTRAGREAPALVRQLGEALGAVVINNLLLALCLEQDRARRLRIFDTLTALGPTIIDHVKLLLDDSRWYVLRNMIALARAVGDRTTLPKLRRLAAHPDLRVKLEAIKSLLRLDKNVPSDLLDAVIASPDPKLAEAAVTLVGDYGIAEGLEPLLALLEPSDPRGRQRSKRIAALRALGELGDPSALERLDRFFKDSWWWGISGEERQAAFESLKGYPPEARQPLLERGLRSRDPAIRAVCARFSQEDAGASSRAGAR